MPRPSSWNRPRPQGWFQPPEAIPETHADYLDLLLDLVALALWTGATRLATVMLDHGQSNRYCPFVPGVQGTWHALSHWRDASGETEDDDGVTRWSSTRSKRDMYSAVVTWHHERVARFLRRLQSLPYGESNLLDASVITYGSSLADGHDHGDRDLPILVAGAEPAPCAAAACSRGNDDISLSSVHLATLRALGVQRESFADADRPLAWG